MDEAAASCRIETLFSVAGRNIVITGGSSGIGRMIATAFAANGANVFIVARKADSLNAVAAEISKLGHCVPVVGDLSSTEGVSALAAEIAERCPELHVVVNNAGTGWYAPIDAFPEDRFDRVFDLNLKAPFFLVQKLLPALTRGASDANWSRVINLSSVGARQANAANAAYGASKAAVEHLTRIMARGLADRKIAVNGIAPGWFPSRLNAGITESQGPDWIARTPLGRFGTMQDMGGLALFLASPAGAFINGQTITIDGGVTL